MTATVRVLDTVQTPLAKGAPSKPARDHVPTVLLAPAVVFMTVVGFYPLLYSLYISITNYNPTSGNPTAWAGAANYTKAFTDGQFWHAIWLSGVFTTLSVGVSLCLAVLLALLFNRTLPGGPDFATDLSSIYLQRVNFQFFNIGYGSALSLVMLAAILVVVMVFVKWSGFLRIVSEREPG